MTDIRELQKTLGIKFRDISLLNQALVHSSYVNENLQTALDSNERLEFLGDAVLGIVIAEKLYRDSPDMSEGEMTCARAAIVRQETLARIAETIRIGEHLYLGKGEEAGGGRTKPANLARGLEALIAAIYLDRGLTDARKFILKFFASEIISAVRRDGVSCKSQLQEISQAAHRTAPVYRLIEESGPPHNRTFTVEVAIGGKVLGRGAGKSKKLAETEAAKAALEKLEHFTP